MKTFKEFRQIKEAKMCPKCGCDMKNPKKDCDCDHKAMNEEPMDGVAKGSLPDNQHMCATKIFKEGFGEGTPVFGEHALPDEEGNVAIDGTHDCAAADGDTTVRVGLGCAVRPQALPARAVETVATYPCTPVRQIAADGRQLERVGVVEKGHVDEREADEPEHPDGVDQVGRRL